MLAQTILINGDWVCFTKISVYRPMLMEVLFWKRLDSKLILRTKNLGYWPRIYFFIDILFYFENRIPALGTRITLNESYPILYCSNGTAVVTGLRKGVLRKISV